LKNVAQGKRRPSPGRRLLHLNCLSTFVESNRVTLCSPVPRWVESAPFCPTRQFASKATME
jgi:hypothetical protein